MSGPRREGFRRIASPSTPKQGPMKATLPYALMQGSPTRNGRKGSPSSSPTLQWSSESHRVKNRRSPDNRASPERSSPSTPAFRVERPKAVRGSPSPSIRRTGSLDTVAGPYLTGQWPRDITALYPSTSPLGNLTSDKGTQTPEEWDDLTNDKKKKGHKRSTSLGNKDELKELQLIKQRLAKGSKQNAHTSARQSPVQGNHAALHTPPAAADRSTTNMSSKAIGIPVSNIPKSSVPRIGRGSVEGLNQEIEKLVLKTISGKEEDTEMPQVVTPDGHRAPVRELMGVMRSVDTQTPSGYADEMRALEEVATASDGRVSSNSGSRSQSESPSFPIIPGQMDNSRPTSRSESSESTNKETFRIEKGGCDSVSPDPSVAKFVPSPKPNKSYAFVRGPPDGCEKIEIDESRRAKPSLKESLFCPVKPNSFLIPSQGSAFCPLYTSYTELALKTPTQAATHTTIEG